jgi:hypothetical protein
MINSLESIVAEIGEGRKDIARFVGILARQPAALAISSLLFLFSVFLTLWYLQRSSRYESIVTATIGASMEATPQVYKGLEALVFSSVKQNVDQSVRSATLNPKFVREYTKFQSDIQSILARRQISSDKEIELVEPKNGNVGVMTEVDHRAPGFLFLPVFLFHDSVPTAQRRSGRKLFLVSDQKGRVSNGDFYVGDAGLFRSVALTRAVAPSLQALADQPILNDDSKDAALYLTRLPAQVYLITKEGVNRIFTRGSPYPADKYASQFPSSTFFPSRPYFWPAVREAESGVLGGPLPAPNATVGSFFYVSRPYLDLGGSGVVITLARSIALDDVTTAVLCFDLQFDVSQNLYTALERNVSELSGNSIVVDCMVTSNSEPHCSPADQKVLDEPESHLLKKVQDKLAESKDDFERSRILGNLLRLDTPASDSPSKISFSLPMDQEFLPNDVQKVKLLLVDLDINSFREKTTLIGVAAASAFGLMTVLLSYLWGSNVMKHREYQSSFSKLAEVMYYSPTPYLRLDSEDRICDMSASFCWLIGVQPTPDNFDALKGKTFRSICANNNSREEYDRVQQLRKDAEQVDSYLLDLKANDGSQVKVRVFSAAVPPAENSDLPETFGILVEQPD